MALLYGFAGINHFWHPEFYLPMMPPFLPYPETLQYLAGAAEIILAIGLFWDKTSRLAAWGVMALLVAIFPANIYMSSNGGAGYDVPSWVLLLRLPFQLVLIAWAYVYARREA